MNLRAIAWSAAAAFVCAVVAPAQTLIVPNGTLLIGQTIKIAYDDPARPGQSVQVVIEDGNGTKSTVTILLDGGGYGTVDWVVPEWNEATFTAPATTPEFREIDPPPAAARPGA
ncbi:MAG: hypothetical protein AB7O97_20400 [Planctomycetota bacterium]